MREIKFRGKCIDNGLWEIGWLYCHDGEYYIKDGVNDTVAPFRIDPATIGQYTGLKDGDGNRIFEGDILRGVLHNHVMTFKEGQFIACVHDEYGYDYIPNKYIKGTIVIGNIHDNPELLRGGEE